jgi:hypothetical protein
MTSKISFFIVLLAAMIFGGTTANAKPLPDNSVSVSNKSSYVQVTKTAKPEWKLPSRCDNSQAKILFKAGFNRPGMLRGAWAITWRESKHQALDESSRWFTGALGTWQIQTSAWSGRSWWSRSSMLDKYQQSVIVRKYFLKGGMHNWGYGYSFKNDSWFENAGMYYALWGSSTTYAWVIAPFNTGWSLFPKKCTPLKA